jgi:hypothetical protein
MTAVIEPRTKILVITTNFRSARCGDRDTAKKKKIYIYIYTHISETAEAGCTYHKANIHDDHGVISSSRTKR